MSNEITINPLKIINLPDNSITDAETIRQIVLWSMKFNDNSLNSKIKYEMQFAGLYPHVQKLHMFDPDIAKKISEEGRTIIVNARNFGKTAALKERKAMLENTDLLDDDTRDSNYQAEINYDKYEIMLSANSKSVYPVGHLHKFTNDIFDKKTGIAFFQIDNHWDVLWQRRFTGYFDKDKNEIYDQDYLENESMIYKVIWNRNQTQWWLEPVKIKIDQPKDVDVFFEYAMQTQSLGNGYFKRDDLTKIGNAYENTEIEKS